MTINLYAITFIASIIMLVILIALGQGQNINNYLLVFVTCAVSSFGYYTVSLAQTVETALIGHRLVYLGGVFTPMLVLFCAMNLCRIKIPKLLIAVLLAFSTVVLYYAYTIETSDQYYTSFTLGRENGISFMIKEYGPMHDLYYILLFGCMGLTLGVVFYSLLKRRTVSYRVNLLLIFTEVFTVLCYVFKRAAGSNIEWVAVAYLIDELVILLLIRRIGMYEVSDSIANSLKEYSTYGYMVFDKHRRYVGCNDMAKKYMPELLGQQIDYHLNEEKTPLLFEYFEEWMKIRLEDKSERLIETENRVLRCTMKKLYHGHFRKHIGFLIELVDETQQQKYLRLLNHYNQDLKAEVQKKTEHVSLLQDKLILGMADMIENRDSNTGGHIKRTSAVIRIFTGELQKFEDEYGFSEEFLDYLAKAAPMHDLGKIAIDDRVLRKPGKYTPEEFDEMKKHAEKGAEIVASLLEGVEDDKFLNIARNVAHYHHEKWNGEGYPRGIAGIAIPPEARIMALADVFDALVSKRCYKEKMDYDTAFQIIEDSLGSHFDPELGKLFLKCRPQLEAFYDEIED